MCPMYKPFEIPSPSLPQESVGGIGYSSLGFRLPFPFPFVENVPLCSQDGSGTRESEQQGVDKLPVDVRPSPSLSSAHSHAHQILLVQEGLSEQN